MDGQLEQHRQGCATPLEQYAQRQQWACSELLLSWRGPCPYKIHILLLGWVNYHSIDDYRNCSSAIHLQVKLSDLWVYSLWHSEVTRPCSRRAVHLNYIFAFYLVENHLPILQDFSTKRRHGFTPGAGAARLTAWARSCPTRQPGQVGDQADRPATSYCDYPSCGFQDEFTPVAASAESPARRRTHCPRAPVGCPVRTKRRSGNRRCAPGSCTVPR